MGREHQGVEVELAIAEKWLAAMSADWDGPEAGPGAGLKE